ncbi:Short-chain dehydrogenase [Geosmithia morbida]|uniref:Short-chain dehydrogenase n=1 Tax=Geosmithia morbida TaxID=1094350 RepID=A0A9P4YSI7_9HYPO|nr:Short-chain dehydrogenase [Geosmithia morbida]KAF4122318.1 Short-chain dehydrogenase [Geosmithia morbida]
MARSVFPGVALITGAGGTEFSEPEWKGIGAAVTGSFARSGCPRTALTDLNAETLDSTSETVRAVNPGIQVFAQAGDISQEGFVESFVRESISRLGGRIDYSVQCAGVLGRDARSHKVATNEFDLVDGVNYKGTWLVVREVLRQLTTQTPLDGHLKQRGAVVNIASQLGVAAIISMTKSDAIDYSQDDIRVNSVEVAPAGAVMFLCSSQASFIQGHALVVDGGYTIN